MSGLEPLDLYDACGRRLNQTKPRAAVHRDGDWHKTFHCWIIFTDAGGQEMIVFQRRGPQVELWPNKLDITAAGHYRASEGLEGGLRELAEELGVTVTAEQLRYVGIRVNVNEFQAGIKDHELQEVHFLTLAQELRCYTPQREEVAALFAFPLPNLLQLFAAEIPAMRVRGVEIQPTCAGWRECEMTVSRRDFIPTLDQYYQRAALTAQQILRGERYIWI